MDAYDTFGKMCPKILTCGVTGSGKSTLQCRLSGNPSLFKVGHTLLSETSKMYSAKAYWLGDPTQQIVEFIDTAGFFDNRADTSAIDQLKDMLSFLSTYLRDGFNICLFLIPVVNSRLQDAHIQSLRMLSILLGGLVFKKLWIVLTQVDRLNPTHRASAVDKYRTEGVRILNEHLGDKGSIVPEQVIVYDHSRPIEEFGNILFPILKRTPVYVPALCTNIDDVLEGCSSNEGLQMAIWEKTEIQELLIQLNENQKSLIESKKMLLELEQGNKDLVASLNNLQNENQRLRNLIASMVKKRKRGLISRFVSSFGF